MQQTPTPELVALFQALIQQATQKQQLQQLQLPAAAKPETKEAVLAQLAHLRLPIPTASGKKRKEPEPAAEQGKERAAKRAKPAAQEQHQPPQCGETDQKEEETAR